MTRLIVAGVDLAGTIVVFAAVFFYFAHHHSKRISAQAAEAEFQLLRDRFVSQKPLLDMDQRRVPIDTSAQAGAAPLHTFHTMIFDTRGGERLVRVTVAGSGG